MKNSLGLYVRRCCICSKEIASKKKIKISAPCISCSRSLTGKNNSKKDICPICNLEFPYSPINKLNEHAALHDMTGEELWAHRQNCSIPSCRCGCGETLTFWGWLKGWPEFILGHNASVYSSYDEETAKKIIDKRAASLKGKIGWAKGLTKETNEIIAHRGQKTSIGRKKAFDEGKIKIWSKGLSKETDVRVLAASEQAKEDFTAGRRVSWHKGLTELTDERVLKKNNSLREKLNSENLYLRHNRLDTEKINKILELNIHLRFDRLENYRNVITPALWVNCTNCSYFEKVSLLFARNDRCPRCSPAGSKAQLAISDWIEQISGFKVGRNVRLLGRKEIDIYVLEKNFAIEFNGLYYHNEAAGKDESYHQSKSSKCSQLGIKLLHVFEDEWNDKQDIIKSMIKHRLGLTPTKISARKCDVIMLDRKQKEEFFDANHIDGDTLSMVSLGLRYDNEIVAAISLRLPFNKKYLKSLEVTRYCTRIDTAVNGGLSKLTKHAMNFARTMGKEKLMTYVDTRFASKGATYMKSGWRLKGSTPSKFWWTDFTARFDSQIFKKTKKLADYEIAADAGMMKIWGCPMFIYEIDVV